tara:strand:+ start:498 stop:707 length:210 start_codon:yes stop_codon:yes gene_type:complete
MELIILIFLITNWYMAVRLIFLIKSKDSIVFYLLKEGIYEYKFITWQDFTELHRFCRACVVLKPLYLLK